MRATADLFRRDGGGNIAIFLSLALVPVIGMVGLAIDYALLTKARQELQAIGDSGALAGASLTNATDDERIARARDYVDANHAGNLDRLDIDVVDGRVVVAAARDIETVLMQIFDITHTTASIRTEAIIPRTVKTEIALVLDYSGSMNRGGKYQAMRDSSIELITGLADAAEGGPADQLKVGLVPFSEYVYTGMRTDHIRDVHPSYFGATVRACLDSRRYPYARQSSTPNSSNNDTRWPAPGMPDELRSAGSSLGGDHINGNISPDACTPPPASGGDDDDDDEDGGWVPPDYCQRTYSPGEQASQNSEIVDSDFASADSQCGDYRDRDVIARPLTTNFSSLISQLNSMRPVRLTNIALALEFGWHMMTTNQPYDEAKPADGRLVKAIVLLTDGSQTVGGFGPGGSFGIDRANRNTEALCGAVKDDEILLITVAFDLDDTATRNRLRDCASSTEYYFEAETNTNLALVFRDIAAMFRDPVRLAR